MNIASRSAEEVFLNNLQINNIPVIEAAVSMRPRFDVA